MRRAVTREEVLELSASLFARNGYKETNLKLVSDRLDVTRQALYYHFRSKADILGALFDELMTKLEEAVAAAAEASGEPRFAAMLKAHLTVILDNPDLAAILLHERPQIAKIEELNASARRHRYSDAFVAAYKEGVRKGELRKADPWVTVNGLLAAVNVISWWYHDGDRSRKLVADGIYELLGSGFLAGERP